MVYCSVVQRRDAEYARLDDCATPQLQTNHC